MTELLPCPFCGGPALFEYVRSGGTMSSGMEPPTCYAGCKKCGVRFSGGETQGWDSTRRWYDRLEEAHDKAAENWNHRHSAEIAGALEQLRDLHDSIRTVYDAVPALPITADTMDAATDALHAFCLLVGIHRVDVGDPQPQPAMQQGGGGGE